MNQNAQMYAEAIVSSDWASAMRDVFRNQQIKTVGSGASIQGDCVVGQEFYEVDMEFHGWRAFVEFVGENFDNDGRGLEDWSEWTITNETIRLTEESFTVTFRRHMPVSVQMIGLDGIAKSIRF